MIRRLACLVVWLVLPWVAQASNSHDDRGVIVYGKTDAGVPGWAISTDLPAGWTEDCCTYAKAIGVNLVLYQGEWTGKPDRVMVLNVWTSKLATLDNEWQDDRKHYLQRDPAVKVEPLPLHDAKLACRGFLYHGSDKVDDAVVFCDPGKASGIRLSWSMAVGANDPVRAQALAQFEQVVAMSSYMRYVDKPATATTPRH